MFGSLLKLVDNVVTVAAAPVEMAVDLTNAGLKPIVEGVEELKKDVKNLAD